MKVGRGAKTIPQIASSRKSHDTMNGTFQLRIKYEVRKGQTTTIQLEYYSKSS